MLSLCLVMPNAWSVPFDVKCLVCAFWCQMLGLCLLMSNVWSMPYDVKCLVSALWCPMLGLCLNMMLNAWSVHYDSKCLVCALWCQKLGVCLVMSNAWSVPCAANFIPLWSSMLGLWFKWCLVLYLMMPNICSVPYAVQFW